MKRNNLPLRFYPFILLFVFCCSCSVCNKVHPFDYFIKNAPVLDDYMSISEEFFGRNVSYVISLFGPPDYQTGVMEYIDDTRVSPYWYLLGRSYEHSTIPIKAYAWKRDDGYVLCCCSYNDFRLTQMPQCLIYNNGQYLLQGWLSQYSGDDGFAILGIKKIKELSSYSISCCNKVEWFKYNQKTSIDFFDFYNKTFSFKPVGISKSLFEMTGKDRTDIISLLGEPNTRKLYRKSCATSKILNDSWIGYDIFPAQFYVDEYRYEDKYANSTGTLRCYYKETEHNMILIFASILPDEYYYVEY